MKPTKQQQRLSFADAPAFAPRRRGKLSSLGGVLPPGTVERLKQVKANERKEVAHP